MINNIINKELMKIYAALVVCGSLIIIIVFYFVDFEAILNKAEKEVKQKIEKVKEETKQEIEEKVEVVKEKVEDTKDKIENKIEEKKDELEDKIKDKLKDFVF